MLFRSGTHTITLNDLVCTSSESSPIKLSGDAKVNLILVGTSALTGSGYHAGIEVPSKIDDIFKAVRGDSYFAKYADIAKFSELFSVHDWYFILPKKEANLYYLSKTDIAELDDSIAKYGSMAWEELREKSHDYAWHATAKDRPIAVADIMREDGADEEFINHVTSLMDFQKACL